MDDLDEKKESYADAAYWSRWFFKAFRTKDILKATEKNAYGADILWLYRSKWYERFFLGKYDKTLLDPHRTFDNPEED